MNSQRNLTRRQAAILLWIMVPPITGLGVLGAIGSFATVQQLAEPWFGHLAWIVPLGVDLGILILLGWDLVMEYLGLPLPPVRWIAWAFIVATVYLNIAAAGGQLVAAVMHAAMPALFVTVVEGARHLIRRGIGLATATRIEPIPTSRWLLAPVSTFVLWRRMVLWHVRPYRAGLELQHQHLLQIAQLQQEYGRWQWRWRAPLQQRLAVRLQTVAASLDPSAREPAAALQPAGNGADASEQLLAAARAVRDDLEAADRKLTQQQLARGLREQGHSVANNRLRTLMTQLTHERATD